METSENQYLDEMYGEEKEICNVRTENETLKARLDKAGAFTVQDFGKGESQIIVRRQAQVNGDVLWQVSCDSFTLNRHTGKWNREPSPSDRDDKYLTDYRYETLNEAWKAAETAKCPYGRVA